MVTFSVYLNRRVFVMLFEILGHIFSTYLKIEGGQGGGGTGIRGAGDGSKGGGGGGGGKGGGERGKRGRGR